MTIRIISRESEPVISLPNDEMGWEIKRRIEASEAQAVEAADIANETLRDHKGRTIAKNARRIGEIPLDLWACDPMWFYDDNNMRRFLRANPKFRVGRGNI